MLLSGKTCLHLAAEKAFFPSQFFIGDRRYYSAIVTHLVTQCEANVNAKEGKAGETILHRAVQSNHMKMVRLLLQFRETDVNCRRYDGKTPYQLATLLNLPPMQELLLRHNAVAVAVVDSDEDVMDTSDYVPAPRQTDARQVIPNHALSAHCVRSLFISIDRS